MEDSDFDEVTSHYTESGLRHFLNEPDSQLSVWYFKWQLYSLCFVLGLAFVEQFMLHISHTSLTMMLIESYFLFTFGVDFVLRLKATNYRDLSEIKLLLFDFVTLMTSLYFVLLWFGFMPEANALMITLLQLLRIFRIEKIVRRIEVIKHVFKTKSIIPEALPEGLRSLLFVLVIAILSDAYPQIKEEFPPAIMMTIGGIMVGLFGYIVATGFSQATSKSYDLAKLVASFWASVRAFTDDVPEFNGPDTSKRKDLGPLELEAKVNAYLEGQNINTDDLKVDADNWFTACLRAFRDDGKVDQSTLAIKALRADLGMGTLYQMLAAANYFFQKQYYEVLKVISWVIFACLVVPASQYLGAALAVSALKTVSALLLLALKDCDHAIDPDMAYLNPPMPKPLSEHPTRPEPGKD